MRQRASPVSVLSPHQSPSSRHSRSRTEGMQHAGAFNIWLHGMTPRESPLATSCPAPPSRTLSAGPQGQLNDDRAPGAHDSPERPPHGRPRKRQQVAALDEQVSAVAFSPSAGQSKSPPYQRTAERQPGSLNLSALEQPFCLLVKRKEVSLQTQMPIPFSAPAPYLPGIAKPHLSMPLPPLYASARPWPLAGRAFRCLSAGFGFGLRTRFRASPSPLFFSCVHVTRTRPCQVSCVTCVGTGAEHVQSFRGGNPAAQVSAWPSLRHPRQARRR